VVEHERPINVMILEIDTPAGGVVPIANTPVVSVLRASDPPERPVRAWKGGISRHPVAFGNYSIPSPVVDFECFGRRTRLVRKRLGYDNDAGASAARVLLIPPAPGAALRVSLSGAPALTHTFETLDQGLHRGMHARRDLDR
jgi:hypothetical protein